MRIPNIDIEILKKFVGENSEYYLAKWNKMGETKNIISWNWSAFFLHMFWFAARKMYYLAYFFLSLVFFRNYIISVLALPSWAAYLLKYAIWFIIGAIANYLYLLHIEKKLNKISAKVVDNETLVNEVEKNGGINYGYGFIMLLIFFILLVLPYFIISFL